MPLTDEQARGLAYEQRVADSLGGVSRPGSGNQWNSRGDVACRLLASAKATAKRSWAQTRRELREAVDMALGTGLPPALAVLDDDGEELVVIRLSDLSELLAGEGSSVRRESGGERRRRSADVPSLLREV